MQNRTPLFLVCSAALSVVILSTSTGSLFAGEVKETFANISEGALLTTLPNWGHANGQTDNWVLASFGGSDGNGFEAGALGSYRRTLSDSDMLTANGGPYTFKAKIRFTGSTAYASIHLDLLETGGINGLGIRFDGGEIDGASANAVSISDSGTFWGDVKYHVAENSHWQPNVWYQIEISNINLSTVGGSVGVVTIYDKDHPSNKIVDKSPITIYGSSGGTGKLDLISISSVGAERPFQMGDIEIVRSSKDTSSSSSSSN